VAKGGGDWLPSKPWWWSDLVDFVTQFSDFIKNPPRYIVALFLGGVLYVVNTVSNALSSAISAFEAPARALNDGLTAFGELAGGGILDIVGSVNQAAINIALGAGPLAPVGVFLLWLAEMYLLYLLIMTAAPYAGAALQTVTGGGR
jgi:hypothetical protein